MWGLFHSTLSSILVPLICYILLFSNTLVGFLPLYKWPCLRTIQHKCIFYFLKLISGNKLIISASKNYSFRFQEKNSNLYLESNLGPCHNAQIMSYFHVCSCISFYIFLIYVCANEDPIHIFDVGPYFAADRCENVNDFLFLHQCLDWIITWISCFKPTFYYLLNRIFICH